MLALLCILSTASATSDVLFVGNSYTFYNNLETLVAEVFASAGTTVETGRLTAGGLNLSNHASYAADESSEWYTRLVTEADQREWVVLQDQSQTPAFPQTQPEWIASRDAAITLNGLVADAGANTMFFLTWGYLDGDEINDWRFPDYTTMQGHLTAGYTAYAEACSTVERPVWIAPVGPAFGYIREQVVASGEDPLSEDSLFRALYAGDGSHPSALGSHLVAFVFFASLSGETPVGLATPDGFDPETVLQLQEAAAAVVFDDTDSFVFPWEEDPGTVGEPDTGEDEAPACGEEPPVDEEGSDTPGGSGPSVAEEPSEDADEDKGGCSHIGKTGGLAFLCVLLPLVLMRRND